MGDNGGRLFNLLPIIGEHLKKVSTGPDVLLAYKIIYEYGRKVYR